MGTNQTCCCCSSKFINTQSSQSYQRSYESQFTNDIDVLRKQIIQPIKPLPLNKLQSLQEVLDDDIDEVSNHFNEFQSK